jgi:hypothetical protein
VQYVEASADYQRPAYAYQRADYMFYNVSYARNASLNDPFDPDLGHSTFSDRVERFFINATQVTRNIGESVSSSRRVWERAREQISEQLGVGAGQQWIADVPLFGLGCLVLVGMGVLLTQGQIIIPLCVLSSLSVICLTPWPAQFNRYLMPTVPLLALSLCTAIAWILGQSRQPLLSKWRGIIRVLAYLVVAGIALQQVAITVAIYSKRLLPVEYQTRQGESVRYRLFFYVDSYRAFDSGVDWLMAHAKPSEVIAVAMPHWVYIRTGNKTVMPPFESDPIKAAQLLESVPVTYLVLDEGLDITVDSKRFMKGVVKSFPDRWKRVYSDDVTTETGVRHEQAFEIYERVHPAPAAVSHERNTVTHHIPQDVLTVAGHHEAR